MDIRTAILDRRTVHEFSGESVDTETVSEGLKLALWAPNHKLTFPWKFYWAGSETKAKLVQLAADLKSQQPTPPSEIMLNALKNKLGSCSEMIAIGCKKSESEFQQREDYATVACGLQNTCLYLHSKGIQTKWSTGGFTRHEKTYEILGVDSAEVDIVGILLIGLAKTEPRVPERPGLDEFLEKRP